MKKHLIRILLIVSILIFGYQNFCYADVVVDPLPLFIHTHKGFSLIGFTTIIVLIVSSVSFFILKATAKKQYSTGVNLENTNNSNSKGIEKNKDITLTIMLLSIMVLAICFLIVLEYMDFIDFPVIIITAIIFILSFIIRLLKKKKAANMIYGITLIFVCLIGLRFVVIGNMSENYNKRFLDLEVYESFSVIRGDYVRNVDRFISCVKENNKGIKKLSIEYNHKTYTTPEELDELLSNLNNSYKYEASNFYDNLGFLKTVKLNIYINKRLSHHIGTYDDYKNIGSDVQNMIVFLAGELDSQDNWSMNIKYTDHNGKIKDIEFSKNNYGDIQSLKRSIIPNYYYYVIIETVTDRSLNVFITYQD